MKTKTSKIQWIVVALGCATLALTSQSNAAVIITFKQTGSVVLATWNGTITPGSYAGSGATPGGDYYGGGFSLAGFGISGDIDLWDNGVATETLLGAAPSAITGGIYGYGNTAFYFYSVGPADTEDNPSIDFGTGSTYTMTWVGQTLAGIGAASFNNTLAWTGSTGGTNTISFTTVPEPSAALLSILGAVGLVTRRRRQA